MLVLEADVPNELDGSMLTARMVFAFPLVLLSFVPVPDLCC